jgi:hypothetical protein
MADEQQILAEATASSDRVWQGYADYHPTGRPVSAAFPASYPVFGSQP